MDWKSLASKKVAGIPVLYLAAAVVVVFAVWAWQMKSSPTEEATGDENTTAENVPSDGEDLAAADYSGLNGSGTVTVVQQATPTETESVKQTNDDWLRAGVAYLVERKEATAGEAQVALTNYIEGNDLTYEQGQLRDSALAKLGLPPEPITSLGSVGSQTVAPAQRQFSLFPGKHTVKGTNDNSASKLASLYYGNGDANHALKIVATNVRYGNGASYPVGTVIAIPAWKEPRYVTVTKTTRTPTIIAAKNGIQGGAPIIEALNPGKSTPYAVGTKIRIW